MEVLLVQFYEANGTRMFVFHCVGAGRSRTTVRVSADVTLARKYDIRLQELPLLCRRLLDTIPEEGLQSSFTLTEAHMVAIQAAARNVPERKPHKRPRPSSAVGQAWRSTQPFKTRER
jgi:hypothetical protein